MSKIVIEKPHSLTPEQAKKTFAGIEVKLKERYGVTLSWEGDKAQVKGKGVSGEVVIDESRVVVGLQLSLLLRPMAGKIRDGVQKFLDRDFG